MIRRMARGRHLRLVMPTICCPNLPQGIEKSWAALKILDGIPLAGQKPVRCGTSPIARECRKPPRRNRNGLSVRCMPPIFAGGVNGQATAGRIIRITTDTARTTILILNITLGQWRRRDTRPKLIRRAQRRRHLTLVRHLPNQSKTMIPDEKKPYRCKYIFRDRRKMWATSPPPKQPAIILPDPSKMPKGMSFARLDEIIKQRAKTSLPNS